MPTIIHHVVQIVSAPEQAPPAGKRTPFGWPATPIAAGPDAKPTTLYWLDTATTIGAARLRLTVAVNSLEQKKIEVSLIRSQRVVGTFEIRKPSALQMYEVQLSEDDARKAVIEGLSLRQTLGNETLWVFAAKPDVAAIPPTALLHLLLTPDGSDPLAEFYKRIGSVSSLQSFGWSEGCILDGLNDLSKIPGRQLMGLVIRRHLSFFLRADGSLDYQDGSTQPVVAELPRLNSALPAAALAWIDSAHPVLDLVVKTLKSHEDASGAIAENGRITAEGSHTIAYTLAIIARLRESKELGELALKQLTVRQNGLATGKELFQWLGPDKQRGGRNRSLAVAAHLLGLTRTIVMLRDRDDLQAPKRALFDLSKWIVPLQSADGLWPAIVDDPKQSPDTVGSAGIAAALAIGAQFEFLPPSAREAAAKALMALTGRLTPDGFLAGAAPLVQAGDPLPGGDYRIISPMAMGFMAQLIAALPTTHRVAMIEECTPGQA